MLRKIRITFSLIFFCGINLFFLNYFELLGGLTKMQLVPAVLSANALALVFLLLLALLFGRLYCSSLCPLGIYQDIIIWLSRKKNRGKKYYAYSRAKNILRYSILTIAIICFAAGINLVTTFWEPYSLYGGIITHVFRPVSLAANNLISHATDSLGLHILLKKEFIIYSIISLLISTAFFLGIGFLAWRYGRTWCNSVCPVGSLLGIVSRFSVFKIKLNTEKCTNCGLCERKCKASCIESKRQTVDYSRCINCFSCIDTCRSNAINFVPDFMHFKPAAESGQTTGSGAMFSRATFLNMSSMLAAGFFTGFLKSAQAPLLGAVLNDKKHKPVSPPGSVSFERFNSKCTSCHLCVSRCPNHVLVPSSLEYGLEGLMQPVLNFKNGFCDDDCTVCGEICPNGAILPLTVKDRKKVCMGLAVFNEEKCLIIKDDIKCKNCESHCPTQAIKLEERGGKKLPVIDKEKCIGCGACEYYCPAKPDKAFYIDGYETHKIRKL